MKIFRTIEYAAEPEMVFVMVTDEEFHVRKCMATGAIQHSVRLTSEDPPTMVTWRTLPTDSFPEFVRGMVGRELMITETMVWGQAGHDGSRQGRLKVSVGDLPVGMDAVIHLRPGGVGTTVSYDGDLRARIPLFGSKVERAAAPAIESAIRKEHETGQTWLAQ
jgi:hypothetical protein